MFFVLCYIFSGETVLYGLVIVQGSHASWIFLDFFLENSRTWKVLEKHFGLGKSWKNILENYAFFVGSNGKEAEIVNVPVCVDFYFYLFLKTTTVNILLRATVSAMDYTPNVESKWCFFFIFKHSWAPKGPGKFLMWVLESPEFFQ